MKLNLDESLLLRKYPKAFVEIVVANVRTWKNIFFWAIQYLYDDTIKKNIFQTGLNLGNTTRYLFKALDTRDKARQEKAFIRLEDLKMEMEMVYDELIGKHAKEFILKDIDRDLFN